MILEAAQKGCSCEAREKPTSEGVLFSVRWSEAVERNEANVPFSAASARSELRQRDALPGILEDDLHGHVDVNFVDGAADCRTAALHRDRSTR
jgi:hypothetical protein